MSAAVRAALTLLFFAVSNASANIPITPWQPVALQAQADSCGASAVARLLSLTKGVEVDESQVSALVESGNAQHGRGASLAQLRRALAQLGYDSSTHRVDESTLRTRPLPLLLRLTEPTQHYVVLQGLAADWSQIFDPARGFLWVDTQALLTRWRNSQGLGVILELAKP